MNKDKLLKVARLALDPSATAGEVFAAELILEREGTTAKQVLDDPKNRMVEVVFTFKTSQEKAIVLQNYFRITNTNSTDFYRINPRKLGIHIRKDLADEFIRTNATLLSLWRKQLDSLLSAFIVRHDLHSDTPQSGDDRLTEEERAEIVGMAVAMRQATLGKGLLNG